MLQNFARALLVVSPSLGSDIGQARQLRSPIRYQLGIRRFADLRGVILKICYDVHIRLIIVGFTTAILAERVNSFSSAG
jgi:hypothetical protein